jgi:hypothetical protein
VPIEKGGWITCPACREKNDAERYSKLPEKEWDGKGMVYSDVLEKFYSDWGEIEDDAEENDISFDDMRLVICEPVYLHQIDDDEWCDELPDECGELPDAVIVALEQLNKVIRASGPGSYVPGKIAVLIS